jgi:hypothetical protein
MTTTEVDTDPVVMLNGREVPASYATHVKTTVDALGPFTAEQRDTLRALLRPALQISSVTSQRATTRKTAHERTRAVTP